MESRGINSLLQYGDNSDVVRNILKCYQQWKEQPREIVVELVGLPIDEQCRAIFSYLVEHVSYRLDPAGEQHIYSPARLLQEGHGDCKSLTMFVVCCLHCLGVRHIIRFVNFDGGNQYTHVYPVALDEQGNEIILDACETDNQGWSIYNYAREYAKKQDYIYE